MSDTTKIVFEIFKILPQTNCSKCLLPSCLAFAAAVSKGSKKLKDCPDLTPDIIAKFSSSFQNRDDMKVTQAEFIDKLKKKMATVDFKIVAPLIGTTVKNDKIRGCPR